MGRSKNLYFVETEVEIQANTDPDANWAEGVIQVDADLSQQLGRTIRNGNSFRLVGYGSQLKAFSGSADLDIGFAGVTNIQYCPLTKNGVGAWQSLQKQWMKQKQLSSTVGKYVRYDDFEVGWDASQFLPAGRNSNIYMQGLADTASEAITLYGASVNGGHITLESYYDNLNPIPSVSEDPFGNVIKTPKFSNKFPDYRTLTTASTFSSNVDNSYTPDALVGAKASGSMTWFPSDNHLSHMTGTLFYYFKGIAYNRTTVPPTIPDNLKLIITLVYEGWAPLAQTRSAKPVTKKQLSTAPKAKKTTNARRRN